MSRTELDLGFTLEQVDLTEYSISIRLNAYVSYTVLYIPHAHNLDHALEIFADKLNRLLDPPQEDR